MGMLSKDEFMQMMQTKNEQRQQFNSQPRSRVSYFGLKDDGDEAVVRFASDPDEFQVFTVHPVTIDGKFRKVNCTNDLKAGTHSCPLCEAGVQLQNKFYIRLVEYTRDEQGNIIPQAKIWERPTSYIQRLVNLYTEYGSLKDVIFKVKRKGVRGDMKTDYDILFCNPTIYNEQLYPKDFSAFDDYTPIGTAILSKSPEEMVALANEMGVTFQQPTAVNEPVAQTQTRNVNATWTNQDSLYGAQQTTATRTPVRY